MLDEAQRKAFFERGFVVQTDVFTPAEIKRMRSAFERLEHAAGRLNGSGLYRGSQFVLSPRDPGAPAPPRIHRVVWCGAAEPVLSLFGMDPRLLKMAGQLLGSSEMNQLINQAHFKSPGDGVDFPWHQDSTHRRYGRGEWTDANGKGSYVQTVTAIDDMTVDNGPIEFIPGSCKLGHVEPQDGESGQLPAALEGSEQLAATMSAGSVLLFGPYTFHRSQPNGSNRPRRAFINGFAYPGANSRVYPGRGAGRLVRAS